jgi:hypothetical protein
MPSRRSAEPLAQTERAQLLARVSAHGFIDDYSGIRISARGRRFRIDRATVWNVVDAAGVYRFQDKIEGAGTGMSRLALHGQAVMFRDWHYL